MKKFRLCLIVFLSLTALIVFSQQNQYLSFIKGIEGTTEANTLPERTVKNGNALYFEIEYSFTDAYISETQVEGEKYNFLHIEGFAKMGQVGAPALPAHNEIIAMPENSTGKVTILSSEYMEYEGFNIHPALKPARDTEGAPEPEFEKDEKIYNSDEFFPKEIVEITDILLSRETPLAVTQIRPVQFNPVTGKIRVYTKIEYRLEFIGGNKSFSSISENNSLVYTNLLKRNVINSESIPDGIPYKNFDSKAGEKNYIIITHSQYLTQANQLANWKRQMGYSVEVVSQSSWTAAQVKTEIHNRYNSWTPKPDYFVIIGDHTGSYAVPGEMHYTPYSPPDDGPFATDLYYACMGGASDYIPEMAHGRISVSSSSEAGIIVNKIIDYEKTPVNSATFYQNGLNCAQYQDDDDNGYADRRFCHTSENIRDYLQGSHGYTSDRVYYTNTSASVTSLRYNNGYYSTGGLLPSELRSGSFDWNGGSSDITSEINAGKFFVFHRDHGYVGGSGWAHPYYTTTSMNSLSNGSLLPVVFSINCHTGEFQLSNCFAEKFLRMSGKGAVGVVAAAYFSLSGFNDAISIGMIDAIWSTPGLYPVFGSGGTGSNYTIGAGNDLYTMGDVVNQGLYAMLQNWNGSSTYDKYEYELFHWFGDPAMKIWTSNPNTTPISASHPSSLSNGATSITITGCNVSDALATMVYDGELIGEIQLSGGSGTVTFSPLTNSSIDAILTISKHNHKPYCANIDVSDAPTPPVTDFSADDTSPAVGQTVYFTDLSTNTPTSWAWSFNPSTITYVGSTTSGSQNPQVQFDTPGAYTVSLIATNAGGSDTETKNNYINTETPGLWTGNTSDSWSVASNWDDSNVPVNTTNVVIPTSPVGGNYPETNIGGGAECNDLTIETGAHLYIPSNNTLTVYGTLTNNAGVTGLIIKSDNTGSGSLIHTTNGINATVERYLTQMKWHFIGSPVESEVAGVFHLPGGHSDIYLRTHVEATNLWGIYIVPVNTPLLQGRGYECWVADNVNQDETVEFDGILNAGDYTTGGLAGFYDLEFTTDQGYNLISNPYPSALKADIDAWQKYKIANSVWTWSDAFGNYVYWNGTNSNNRYGWGTLTGGIIPSMQAFFVKATATNPWLIIPQSSRVHSSQPYYKNSGMPNTLRLDVEGNGYKDAIFVSFNELATDDYDVDVDVKKMFGLDEAPQLYSIIPEEILSINSLSELNGYRIINLGFECGVPAIFTIEASEIESFNGNITIYIEDLKEGIMYNLCENPSYAFVHEIGNDPNRFLLHFGEPS
ncbi:MAG: hypothetical protein K8R37_15780, partial [Bacteroidales bacterium]|nr:hypothetical protein [Bacteroidales bacterium]